MITFAVILLVVFPIVMIIVWLRRKESARRNESATKEAEFLAAMRANPNAATATASVAPIAPLIVGGHAGAAVPPMPAPVISGSVPKSTPVEPVTAAMLELPRPPTAPPKDGHCLVCAQSVDMRSNDASRWGVKIPEPGADRLIWVHFHCLAARLEEGRLLRQAMEQLIDSLDANTGAPTLTPVFSEALAKARALTRR